MPLTSLICAVIGPPCSDPRKLGGAPRGSSPDHLPDPPTGRPSRPAKVAASGLVRSTKGSYEASPWWLQGN
jgi:hypothetical protein